jgi:thymidylate synthase (FAD)
MFGETLRRVNDNAEKFLGVELPVLDHGYIKLVDYMGDDKTVVDAARVSYGKFGSGTFDYEKDTRLIHFLMREGHTSPFEQCVLTFEVKLPIFVAREWHRHRTARLNEVSGRYTKLAEQVYTPTPERIQRQSEGNRQSSEGELPSGVRSAFIFDHNALVGDAFANYNTALNSGVAREIARIDLPLCTYTKMIWQMDLHNLLNFIRLRTGAGAQWEIKEYAKEIQRVVMCAYPVVYEAFDEYVLHSVHFSKAEFKALKNVLAGEQSDLGIVLNVASKFGIHFAGGPDGHTTNHQGANPGTKETGKDHPPAPISIGSGTGKVRTRIFSGGEIREQSKTEDDKSGASTAFSGNESSMGKEEKKREQIN